MKYLKTIGISLTISLIVLAGFFYLPILSFGEANLGSTITTITGTDSVKNALKVITNANFANLNADKIETSTTTLPLITTLENLETVGTITTGIWNSTDIGIEHGGTGSSTLLSKRILFGNGTNTMLDVGFGTNGQSLVSGGADTLPTWSSVGVDTTATYVWTGHHAFTTATTTINDLYATNITIASSTINEWATASTSLTSKGYVDSKGGDLVVFANPVDALFSNTTNAIANNMSTVVYTNNADEFAVFSVKIPKSAVGISSIEVLYERDSTGNLYLRFFTGHFPKTVGSTITTDNNDSLATYAGGASDSTTGVLTAPAGSYDGHAVFTEDDVLGIQFERVGTNGSDTYEADLIVYGIEITFN